MTKAYVVWTFSEWYAVVGQWVMCEGEADTFKAAMSDEGVWLPLTCDQWAKALEIWELDVLLGGCAHTPALAQAMRNLRETLTGALYADVCDTHGWNWV